MSKIHYTKPSITDLEIRYTTDAVTNGWGERCYDYINKFEKLFCEHLNVEYAVATSSCTGAMHLGLAALGVGVGDEVIVADINWIASVAPITYLGAKPIFVDVLPDSWCIDPAKIESAITDRTKAIIAVHLYGNVCDLSSLLEIGIKYNIPIIEDAAEAIGSKWRGGSVGAIGKFGVFSFHGTKTLTTGEGGMFVTQDRALYEKVITLNNHGRAINEVKQFWPSLIGFKYKMSNVQAAIGCAQLERIESLIESKRRVFNYYKSQLKELPLLMNPEPIETQNGYWMPTILIDKSIEFNREELLKKFKLHNIDGRVFFWPLTLLPMFDEQRSNSVSYDIYNRAINLPSYHDLTEQEMDKVISIIKEFFNQQ